MMRLPASVAILGKGLDLRFESGDSLFEYDLRGLALCAASDRKTLFLWPMPKRRHKRPVEDFPQAAQVRREWSEFDAEEVFEGRPKLGTALTRLGRVVAIGYRSDKWNRDGHEVDYEHTYDVPPVLVRCGQVLRISGGTQRVTPDGIRG